MLNLPPEIWHAILSILHRRDLRNVALVSRAFLDLARRILAQIVTFGARSRESLQEQTTHLVEHNLLGQVKQLVVKTKFPEIIPWGGLTNLLSLSLEPNCTEQNPYPEKWVQLIFANVNLAPGYKLEEVTVQSDYPIDTFNTKATISGIKKLTWNDGGLLSGSFFSLCAKSIRTLTDLTVVVTEDRDANVTVYSKLWKLRLPNLRLLSVGPGDRLRPHNTLDEAFTRFLNAHPKLESLTLTKTYNSDTEEGDIYMFLHAPTINTLADEILPNLIVLNAHPHQIAMFVDADARFLGTLQTLILSEEPYGLDQMTDSVTELFDSFTRYNERNETPCGIRHLSMFLVDGGYDFLQPSEESPPFIESASNGLPALEVWEGTAPSFGDLKDHLPKLQKLRRVRCNLEYGTATLDKVRELAALCPLLETYHCVAPGREYSITRDEGGSVCNVWTSHGHNPERLDENSGEGEVEEGWEEEGDLSDDDY